MQSLLITCETSSIIIKDEQAQQKRYKEREKDDDAYGEIEGKRQLGRLENRREEYMKPDLKDLRLL